MIKIFSKITKFLLLAAIAVVVFSVNLNQRINVNSSNAHILISDHFISQVVADDDNNADFDDNKIEDANDAQVYIADDTSAESKSEAQKPIDIKEFLKSIAKISTYTNYVFNPLIHFFTFQIGGLLGNDYIYGGKMGEMLHTIWIVSRNIVNIIFVFILLFMALKQIVSGEGEGNTELKKLLPKFAIMLIAINFSWLATKVVLDAANIATNVTFSIPAGVKGASSAALEIDEKKCNVSGGRKTKGLCAPNKVLMPGEIEGIYYIHADQCKDIDEKFKVSNETSIKDGDGEITGYNPPDIKSKNYRSKYNKKMVICWQTMDLSKYNQNNASLYLSYSMAKVQNLTKVSTGKGENIFKMGIGMIFALLIQIVYLVAFASLYIALIIRIAALWLLVSFSPFLVLLYFLTKDLQFQAGGLDEQFSIASFAHWAFAPAKVGAVWSVGFIMVTAGQVMGSKFFDKFDKAGEVTGSSVSIEPLLLGMDNLQQFIWLLMTTGIIWIGTFAVLSKLKVGSFIFTAIDGYGKSLAKYVAKSPTWAPIMPLYDFENKEWKMGSYGKFKGPKRWMEEMQYEYTRDSKSTMGEAKRQFGKKPKTEIEALLGFKADEAKKALSKFTDLSGISATEIRNKSRIEEILKSNEHIKSSEIPRLTNLIDAGRKELIKEQEAAEKKKVSKTETVVKPPGGGDAAGGG